MSQNDAVDIKGIRGAAEVADKNLGNYFQALRMFSEQTTPPKAKPTAPKGTKKAA